MQPIRNNQAGIVIVLAVIIIGVVLSAGVLFSSLIVREIQQSRLIDDSIQAHYIAESGVEHALYQVRRHQAILDDRCSVIVGDGSVCSSSTGYCTNTTPAGQVACLVEEPMIGFTADWRTSASHENAFDFSLGLGQTIQIDLFDPLAESETIAGGEILLPGGIESLAVEWGDQNHSLDLYATLLRLQPGQPLQEVSKERLSRQNCPSPCIFPGSIDVDNTPSANSSYSLRLRAFNFLSDSPGPIRVTAYSEENQGGEIVPILSRLRVSSVGSYGKSEQRVMVQTPTRVPVSGLYDFVIFSEEEIIK